MEPFQIIMAIIQTILMIILIIITFQYRHNTKRTAILVLAELVSKFQKDFSDKYINSINLVMSNEIKQADDTTKNHFIEMAKKNYNFYENVLNLYFKVIEQVDKEWGLKGVLIKSIKEPYNPKRWEELENFFKKLRKNLS